MAQDPEAERNTTPTASPSRISISSARRKFYQILGIQLPVSAPAQASSSSSAAAPSPGPEKKQVCDKINKKIKKKEEMELPTVKFMELFRFADRLDYVLMVIGSVGAFVHGSALPLFLRFFADLVNSFGANANNPDKMTQEVLKVCYYNNYYNFNTYYCSL